MLCDKCKRNTATVHTSYSINGEVTESHLCAECAKNEGFKPFGLDSFFSGVSSDFYDDLPYKTELTCDKCGTTLSEFKKTGKMGCVNCYKVFKEYVNSLIQKIQYGEMHVGKTIEELTNIDKKIIELQLRLKRAVEEENYELASEIKREIQSFKEER